MNLVKWIRKNNRKLMVFVVIFCMVSFVIGYTGLQILTNIFNPAKKALAHYGDGQKINSLDLGSAQNELTILRRMMADQLLTGQGISGALAAHLLFPDSQIAAGIAAQLKQAIQRGQVQISLDELEAYFNQPPQRPEILWVLLKDEAYRAGYIVSAEQAEQYFTQYVTQMVRQNAEVDEETVGQYAAQFFSQTVGSIMAETSLTRAQIFRTLGDLLSVVQYANTVLNNETVTLDQIKSFLNRTQERLDAEYVRIGADTFVDEDAPVSDEAAAEQFQAYKDNVPNMPTEDNPYGFGYKLPKRLQVEYMVVLMDDVKKQIDSPTAEEMEEYYGSNIQRYQRQVPSDPNDPDSEKVTTTRSFAEVAPQIRTTLINEKAANLANMMFNTVKDQTEVGFEQITFEDATVDELQMAAGDYQAVAQNVSQEYDVPVKTGKTGWLSPADLSADEVLSSMALPYQQNRIPLPQLLLSVGRQARQQTRIGLPNLRVWQNIGPIRGSFYSQQQSKSYQLMGMVRVIGIRDEAVPESMDVQYDTSGVVLFDPAESDESVFSLAERVREDLRLKKAMDTAQARAQELAQMAQEQGWDEAVAAYNQQYAPGADDPNNTEPQPEQVALQTVEQQTRASQAEIQFVKQYIRENPSAAQYMQQNLTRDALNNRLYQLLPENAESTETLYEVVMFKPDASAYVVKSVTRQPPTWDDYLENKAAAAMELSAQDIVRLALVHLSPDNITERTHYQPVDDAREETEQPAPIVEEEM